MPPPLDLINIMNIQNVPHQNSPTPQNVPAAGSSGAAPKGHKKHVCHWSGCAASFDVVSALGKHILDLHINCYANSDPLSTTCQWRNCPRMEKAFSTKMKLIMHVRAHTGEKPYACSVPGCSKKFSRMDILNKHLKSHGNASSFVCVIHGCGKVFGDLEALNCHKETHPAAKPFVCLVEGCGKRYTDTTGLYKHTEQFHQIPAMPLDAVAAYKAGVQAGSRRGLSKSSQPLQRLLLHQHFKEFETEDALGSDNESDASAAADSDSELDLTPPRINTSSSSSTSHSHPNPSELSDYDDEEPSPKKPTGSTKRVSFSASSDGDPALSHPSSALPPSSTGNTFIAPPSMPVMNSKNGVPVHLQSSFRVNLSQQPPAPLPGQGPRLTSSSTTTQIFPPLDPHEASLKRRSAEIDESYIPPLVPPEGFSAPLRLSPNLTVPGPGSGNFSHSTSFRPSKQQRLRLSVSEPNLKVYTEGDDDDDERGEEEQIPTWTRKNRRGSHQHPHHHHHHHHQQQQQHYPPPPVHLQQFHYPPPPQPQPQPQQEQEGALDLLLYFSQHQNQSQKQSTSGPSSPTSSSPTHASDSLKLPSISSLRLSSPVMSTVDPRYNSFTGLPSYPSDSPSSTQAPPTTPVRAPIPPSLPEGAPAVPVLPALSSLTSLPSNPSVSGGSFNFTKPLFADRPVKGSQSAPNLSSDSGLSSLSFVMSHPDLLAHAGLSFNPQQGK